MVNPSYHAEEDSITLKCGDRSIVFRACKGERGENGPFPCFEVQGTKKTRVKAIHSEAMFNELWEFMATHLI